MVKTNIQTFTGEVEVLEEFYVGSNLVANDVATHVLTVNNPANDAKIKSDFFVGDGGLLSNIATTLQAITDQGNTASNVIIFNSNIDVTGYKNVGFVTTSNVGIQNTAPTHTLSIGDKVFFSNNTNEALGESVMVVEGRINATRFQGDGGLLSNIATTLQSIADQGNTSSNVLIFNSNVDVPGYRGIGFVTTSNVGIQNTNPGFNTLSVGSNLFVNIYGSNVLTVHGNAAVSNLLVSEFSISPAHGLQDVTLTGRHSTETIQLTNTTTGLEVTSNINVAGEVIITDATRGLDVTSNIELGGRLKFDTNVFVDTLRVADIAANIVTYDRSTGELLDSSGTFMNKFAVVSEQPPSDFFANTTNVANHGTYTLTTSNLATNSNTFNAFDGTANAWVSGGLEGGYIGGSNVFKETNLTQLSNLHPTRFGDWLAIEFPYKTTLRHMKLTPLTAAQFPARANVYATNNDITWSEVKYWGSATDTSLDLNPVTDSNVQTITVNATEQFKKYALVATKAAGNSSNVAIQDWQLFTESFSIDGGKVAMAQQAATGGETVMDQSGPHGRLPKAVPLKKYPEIAFDASKIDGNDTTNTHVQAGYTVTASSVLNSDYHAWRIFNDYLSGNDGWATPNHYNMSSPGEAQSGLGATQFPTASGRYGEYVDLQLPVKIKVNHFIIKTRPNTGGSTWIPEDSPGAGYLYGSNDGTTWTEIKAFSGLTYGGTGTDGGTQEKVEVNSTTAYKYLRLQATHRVGQNGTDKFVAIGALEYYGYEEDPPAGDTSVDTTFTSIMNTPQTTGANVYVDGNLGETFTNRVVGPTPTGTSATYDQTGKYWELTGELTSNVTIEANTFLQGDAPHSVSVWFNSSNLEANVSNSCIFSIGTEERIDYIIEDDKLDSNTYSTERGRGAYLGQKLLPKDGAAGDRFGAGEGGKSVSMNEDGTIAVIGAFGDDTWTGSVYIFIKNEFGLWKEFQKLVASDATQQDRFGFSTAISADGNYILVGSYLADSSDNLTTDVGCVYVFKRDGSSGSWQQQQILQSTNISASDWFGKAVAISADGTYAVVGERLADQQQSNAGAVYVFKRTNNTWGTPSVIQASDAQADAEFGSSVDISNDGKFIVAAAMYDDNSGITNAGAVYVFARTTAAGDNTWQQQQKLTTPVTSGQTSPYFGGDNQGCSITSDGSGIWVNSYADDQGATNRGACYFFIRTGTGLSDWSWGYQQNIVPPPDAHFTSSLIFGRAGKISKDGFTAIVHAREDSGSTDMGAVYVYHRSAATDTFTYVRKINHTDPAVSDHFGHSLDLSKNGDVLLIGNGYDDDNGDGSGAAWIILRDTPRQTTCIPKIKLKANTWHNLTYAYQGGGGSRVTYLDGRKIEEEKAIDTFERYPPYPLWNYDRGGYRVTASSQINSAVFPAAAWEAFNYTTGDDNDGWVSSSYYEYDGVSSVASTAAAYFQGVRGEWLNLELPHRIYVGTYVITSRPGAQDPESSPGAGRIYGSNDGVNWDLLTTFSGLTYGGMLSTSSVDETIVVNSSKAYKHVRLQVTARAGSYNNDNTYVSVAEAKIYGHRENDLVRLPDPTRVLKYPHIAMTGYAQRGYKVTPSVAANGATTGDNIGQNRRAWMAFDGHTGNTDNTLWQMGDNLHYTNGSGDATSHAPIVPGHTTRGGWLKLELPHKVLLSKIRVHSQNAKTVATGSEGVNSAKIYGSNNDTSWDVIKDTYALNYADTSVTVAEDIISTSTAYKYIIFQITKTGGGPGAAARELEFYGTEENSSVPIQIGGGNIDKVANFRVYDKFIGEDQALEIWDAQKDAFGRAKSSMTLHKGRLGIGTTEPEGRLAVLDEPDPTLYGLQEFPPVPMNSENSFIEGHGLFRTWGSVKSIYYSTLHLFDKSTTTIWYTDPSYPGYGGSQRYEDPVGKFITDANIASPIQLGPETEKGEYAVLELPYKIKLQKFLVAPQQGGCWRPQEIYYYAKANADDPWTEIYKHGSIFGPYAATCNTIGPPGDASQILTVTTDKYYKYFGLVITRANRGAGTSLSQWRLYGEREDVAPKQSTLDDGRLSLTKSLQVPMISPPPGTDHTPRRDRLVLEYDTSKYSINYDTDIIRDTSGRGNDGTMRGYAYYTFDGNTNSRRLEIDRAIRIQGTPNGNSAPATDAFLEVGNRLPFKGNQPHTVSLWFRNTPSMETQDQASAIFVMWKEGTDYGTTGHGSNLMRLQKSGTTDAEFQWWHWGSDPVYKDPFPDKKGWRHVVCVYTGATVGDQEFYLDGQGPLPISRYSSGVGSSSIDITNAQMVFGEDYYRAVAYSQHYYQAETYLSGIKVYDIAITAEEARKLYHMGRCNEGLNTTIVTDSQIRIHGENLIVEPHRGVGGFYEEGTWCPTIQGSDGGYCYPSTANYGWYIRVGNLVTIGGTVHWSGYNTALSGNICIAGLPYKSNPFIDGRTAMTFGVSASTGIMPVFGNIIRLIIDPGNDFIYIADSKEYVNTWLDFTLTPTIDNDGHIYGLGGTYRI